MKSIGRRFHLVLALSAACLGSATAQQQVPTPVTDVPVSGREEFLAVAIAAMMLCGLVNFLLMGRVSLKVHAALSMLSVLVGGFGLLVLFGNLLYQSPVWAVAILFLLIAMFKLMGQFELGAWHDRAQSKNKSSH